MCKWSVVCFAIVLGFASAAAKGADLKPATGDRIRVDVFGRPDLSVEQDIQPSGTVRLPLVGEIAAAGLSLDDIEKSIRGLLAEGAEASPSVLVTVIRWRPVYVLGDVREPRSVEYTPDLTVLKAVTLAGGFGPPGASELTRVEAIHSRERLNTAYAQYGELRLRQASLLAQRDGLEEIDFPAANRVTGRPEEVAELVDSERRMFGARQNDIRGRLGSLDRLALTYRDEIAALQTQKSTLDRELEIVSSDLEASEALEAKGLELRSRNSATQRSRLDVMSRLADNAALSSRASANLEEALQKRASVPIDETQDVLKELNQVQKSLRQVREVIVSESRILGQSGSRDASEPTGTGRDARIEIVRGDRRLQVSETTTLDPGDVIEVVLIDRFGTAGGRGDDQEPATPP